MPVEMKTTVFVGTFSHSLDDKRRLAVPAKWRAAGSGSHEFVVMPSPKGYLMVFSDSAMAKMVERAEDISIGEYERQSLLRMITSESHSSPCDSSGRISLTEDLMKHAGIEGEAVLVGMLNKFEIWSPARLAAEKQSSSVNFTESAKLLKL